VNRKTVVIDTNVIAVANGKATHVDLACQLACTESLQYATLKEIVLIDDRNLILDEYQRYASHSGQPGVGDAFFTYLYNNQYSVKFIQRVPITPSNDPTKGFEELPGNALKAGDRAFLAVAVTRSAEIVNATDSDWAEQKTLLDTLGVDVRQLCPRHANKDNS
jgi:hypothetical protein